MEFFFLFLLLFSGLAAFIGLINPKIIKCQNLGRFKTFIIFITITVGSFIAFGMVVGNKYGQVNNGTAAADLMTTPTKQPAAPSPKKAVETPAATADAPKPEAEPVPAKKVVAAAPKPKPAPKVLTEEEKKAAAEKAARWAKAKERMNRPVTIVQPEKVAPPAVKNSEWDGSVRQVERYLENNLKDPDSVQYIEWSQVAKLKEGYMVRCKYRAKNSFGGYVVANQVFWMNAAGAVVNVTSYQ